MIAEHEPRARDPDAPAVYQRLSPIDQRMDLTGRQASWTLTARWLLPVDGWRLVAQARVRSVVFHECLGLSKERARQAWEAGRAWLAVHPATPTCRPGLSPHAPYSVRASLMRQAARFASKQNLALAIHFAET